AIDQPPPTDSRGETRTRIRATTAGIAQIRLRLNGAIASETRPLECTAPTHSFVNVAAAAGVDFVMRPMAYPRAVAIADYDGDGYPDIFVAVSGKNAEGIHVGAASFLLRNRGDATFEDITVATGSYRTKRNSPDAGWGQS